MKKNENLATAMAAFKALFFADAPAAVEFTAKDGTKYRSVKNEVGEAVEVADVDGNYTPAADGSIELEDGTVLTVKDGKIEDLKAAEVQMSAEDIAKKEAADKAAADSKPAVSKEDFDTLTQTLTDLQKIVADLVTKNGLQMAAMYAAVEAMSNASEDTAAVVIKKHSAFSTAKTVKDASMTALKAAMLAANEKP
jgi:hypothetical protein